MPNALPPPRLLSGLRDIAAQYDALFCDAWGVIHNGRHLFPGVAEALSNFRAQHGPVLIVTNAPRLEGDIPPQLARIGLPDSAYDRVITSGEATRAAVARRPDVPFFRIGPDKDDNLFGSLPNRFTPLADAEAILCTGLFDDSTESPEDYRTMLQAAASRRLPMICANPDKIVQFGDRMIYCAGALAELYEQLGGEVILCGKPHPPIYALARAALGAETAPPRRILAIGDGLETDILGANREGVDVVFIADGIFRDACTGADGRLSAPRAAAALDQYAVHAEYVMEGLRW